jgi:uncharacterized membrane protein YccC
VAACGLSVSEGSRDAGRAAADLQLMRSRVSQHVTREEHNYDYGHLHLQVLQVTPVGFPLARYSHRAPREGRSLSTASLHPLGESSTLVRGECSAPVRGEFSAPVRGERERGLYTR